MNDSHEGTKSRRGAEQLSAIVMDCGCQLQSGLHWFLSNVIYEKSIYRANSYVFISSLLLGCGSVGRSNKWNQELPPLGKQYPELLPSQ
jgi:hypothetical protein